jgi:imidazoleglycerol phosphate dehydratase HisB
MKLYRYAIFLETPELIAQEKSGQWPEFIPGALRALYAFHEIDGVYVACGGSPSEHLKQFLSGEGLSIAWMESSDLPDSEQKITIGATPREADFSQEARYINLREAGSWNDVVTKLIFPDRTATVERTTNETAISIHINLDGTGKHTISTGLSFFDHMLAQLSRHSQVDLTLTTKGDLEIDEHHTVEDTALALGEAFEKALGDKRGITRYAFVLPMDDCLAQVAVDFSGRPWLVWNAKYKREKIGDMPTEMFYHFFKSFSDTAKLNLNIKAKGDNEHHKIESTFKALGRCIGAAVKRTKSFEIPSTKGIL